MTGKSQLQEQRQNSAHDKIRRRLAGCRPVFLNHVSFSSSTVCTSKDLDASRDHLLPFDRRIPEKKETIMSLIVKKKFKNKKIPSGGLWPV